MQAAALFEGLSLDLFPPCQNDMGLSEVDGFGRQVVRVLAVTVGVVVIDEAGETLLELRGQIASILDLAVERNAERTGIRVKLVAAEGLEPPTKGL